MLHFVYSLLEINLESKVGKLAFFGKLSMITFQGNTSCRLQGAPAASQVQHSVALVVSSLVHANSGRVAAAKFVSDIFLHVQDHPS